MFQASVLHKILNPNIFWLPMILYEMSQHVKIFLFWRVLSPYYCLPFTSSIRGHLLNHLTRIYHNVSVINIHIHHNVLVHILLNNIFAWMQKYY